MTSYRKRGTTVRWENGTLIRVTESGVAIEQDGMFECYPTPGGIPASVILSVSEGSQNATTVATKARAEGDGRRILRSFADAQDDGWDAHDGGGGHGGDADAPDLPSIANHLQTLTGGLHIERLILTAGEAEHEYGDVRWHEQTRRLHLSLTSGRLRVLIDTASFDLDGIACIADVLRRAEDVERDPPALLRLAPNVTAALLPFLVGLAPPNVTLLQTAGGIDGRGMEIVEAASGWPNWYRPSYRVRPVRAPLNLRLECDVTGIDRDRPVAVALLAPVHGLLVRVLVDDGRCAWPATVRLTRIDAVARERVWYPYGAGSFGAEMML